MEIQCIQKSGSHDASELILAIGGVYTDGKIWKMSEEVAIDGIKNGKYRFFINDRAGQEVEVILAKSPDGREYLKTHADGEEPKSLLGLPDCPKMDPS